MHEEMLLKQKSRIQWLKEGDRNSSFFHNQLKNRWNRNKILSIENELGVLEQGHDAVKGIAVNYFENLLGKPLPSPYEGLQSMGNIFTNFISSQQATLLERDVTDAEILSTLKSMKRNKSPGPDGFNVNFFLSWDIVGKDFIAAVQAFFRQDCLLKGTNSTAIFDP